MPPVFAVATRSAAAGTSVEALLRRAEVPGDGAAARGRSFGAAS